MKYLSQFIYIVLVDVISDEVAKENQLSAMLVILESLDEKVFPINDKIM